MAWKLITYHARTPNRSYALAASSLTEALSITYEFCKLVEREQGDILLGLDLHPLENHDDETTLQAVSPS